MTSKVVQLAPASAGQLEGLLVPVGKLRPFAGNPRRGDVSAIVESLAAHGQYRPVVARKDGEVLAGNHTLAAALELGWTHLAAVRLDVDDDTARRIVLADNRTADLGSYDQQLLADLLGDLDGDLAGTGYDEADLSSLLADLEAAGRTWRDAPVRPLPEHPVSKLGQRWRLGVHTLVCGDATDPDSWSGCPAGDVLLTDPPYGIGYSGGPGQQRAAIAGDASGLEAAGLVGRVLDVAPLRPGCLVYVFTATGADGVRVQAELVNRRVMRWTLVWVKDRPTLGRADYQQQHEAITYGRLPDDDLPPVDPQEHDQVAYGWIPGAPRRPVTDRKHTTVLTCPRPRESKDHPTMKPVPLLEQLLAAHGLPAGSLVLEPFAGSGSSLVAAHLQGLTCWAVEAEPAYCDVVLDRWRDATGTEPVPVDVNSREIQPTGEPA